MMYPYASIDGVEIVHSELLDNGRVIVHCEKPNAVDGFHIARFELPGCTCLSAEGFEPQSLRSLMDYVHDHERDILMRAAEATRELAQKQRGG